MVRTLWTAAALSAITLTTSLSARTVMAQAPGTAAPAVQGPQITSNFRLAGTWAGVSYLDEDRLGEHLATITDPSVKEALLHKIGAFLSVVVAYEFRADGYLESELEVADEQGVPQHEPTTGRWKIIEQANDRMIVELTEILPDRTEQTTRRLIQFYEDGDHLAILMDTDAALAPFNPLFILERVPTAGIAESPGSANAAASGSRVDR